MLGLQRLFSASASGPEASEPSPALSIISEDATVWGTITLGSVDLRIEGCIHGDVSTDGRVYVAPDAEVYGNVRAQSIRVAGFAEGDLEATDTLILLDSAEVHGTLQADVLKIEPGSRFSGEVRDADAEDASSQPARTASSGDSVPSFLPTDPPEPSSPPSPTVDAPARSDTRTPEPASPSGSSPPSEETGSPAATADASPVPAGADRPDGDEAASEEEPTPSAPSTEDEDERYGFRW